MGGRTPMESPPLETPLEKGSSVGGRTRLESVTPLEGGTDNKAGNLTPAAQSGSQTPKPPLTPESDGNATPAVPASTDGTKTIEESKDVDPGKSGDGDDDDDDDDDDD